MNERAVNELAVNEPAVGPAGQLAAVVDGGADDIQLVAALAAVAAVTGTGEVGRRLGGRGATPPRVPSAPDPWTTRARSSVAPPAAVPGDRRIHRWARETSHRP